MPRCSAEQRQGCQAAPCRIPGRKKVAAEELANAKAAKEELETAQAALQKQYDDMNSDISAILAEAEQTRMSAEEAKKKEEEAVRRPPKGPFSRARQAPARRTALPRAIPAAFRAG